MNKLEISMNNPGNWGPEEIHGQWPCVPGKYLTWTTEPRDIGIWVDYWQGLYEMPYKYNIAVLMEPAELLTLHGGNYEFVQQNEDKFDLIFSTYPQYAETLKNPSKAKYYAGGCRSYIRQEDWMVYPKTKNITCIMSSKREMPGHNLRHVVRELHGTSGLNSIEYNNPPIDSKILGTKDYMYELVIENCDNMFFSEKLLDAMLVGCLPIYWSNTDTSYLDIFDKDGIVFFRDENELIELIKSNYFTEELYNSKLKAIQHNFEIAKTYTSLGDILWTHGINEFLKQHAIW